MCRYIIIGLLVGVLGSSCLMLRKEEAVALNRLERPIDLYTDTLISKYGTRIDAEPNFMTMWSFRSDLDSLEKLAGRIHNRGAQELVQGYLMDCKGIYLLSLNPNLNGNAFAEVLGALGRHRARLRAVVNGRVR